MVIAFDLHPIVLYRRCRPQGVPSYVSAAPLIAAVIQESMAASGHATRDAEILIGAGKAPARTFRQIEVLDRLVRPQTSFTVINLGAIRTSPTLTPHGAATARLVPKMFK